ncbi:transcription factor TFIIIB component B'' homolog isoform X2 [Anarrhichthys ocellatus]|uniref:transcription factor TFIIIB component B'' homolog isoform X2 n=1 Tax=Anarrhichthys ocellatus TaxID=433405 RepID=UPI0012ECFA54|nr:transcription factor TFIIIB component B'' homolog isoform X2 [Anarrhichthys ocellatus]
MFRRSRFSARPNVVKAGKTPQEAPSANQEASETPKDVGESSAAAAVTDIQSVVTPSEKATAPGDGNDQNGEGASSSAAVQRRKRFSIKPKVAPGRPATVARMQKSHVKAVSETPIEVPVSDRDKPTTSSQTGTTVAPQRLQSPRRRRPSEESKQPKMQHKPALIPSDSSEPSADSATNLPADSGKELESTSDSQVKGVPSRLPDKVPPSLPDKEAIALSEKAKTLVSSKSRLSISAPALSLSRLLNDPSDLQRIAKAQKLRALLRQEMHKEKKLKKSKTRAKEFTLDPAKMTMRDLIRYLPQSNPMTSSVEESAQENETVVPPSPGKEVCKPCSSPEREQEAVVLPKLGSPREGYEDEEEEEDDDGTLVPQVKVAEDGSLIIDEESLTVEVLRAKGPNPANDRDPIFERGSTTTYSSFRKGTYTKPWSSEETDMFFLAVSMVGTDFSMICQLFPLRARSEIKNKFKKEERENSWRVDKAFRERRKLDIEYFSKLLEKILEVQKTRKKLKSLAGKNSPKKTTRKAKGKKAARKLSVVEEEDEEEQKVIAALEEEGEKENEDLCNEGGTDDVKPKKKCKRKNREDALTEEPNDKKNKTGEKSNEQDEAYTPGDSEAALPEDCPTSDISEKTESVNEAKDAKIKPAKLSRGRGPKPLLPLGRKWGKKPPPPSTKTNDTASDKGEESVIDGGAEDQVNKDASPLSQADKKKSANDDSEEEDATVQPPRPTRYGRMPKPIKLLNYPAKEAASEATPALPEGSAASAARPKPKCTAKRGRSSKLQSSQESKKPKLVTLRASHSDYSDDEEEQQREEDVEEEEPAVCSSRKDSTAPVFVPAGLRSPRPVISEVEETMEELDILANIPDVFGISQDALCPDASCERAQNETGTDEPCDHQLDLLVDVIDLLTSDPTEVSEAESYNEAAQTLLTIGHLAPLPQSAQNQIDIQDHKAGTTLADVNETSQHLEEETESKAAVLEEDGVAPLLSTTSDHGVKETSETVTIVEILNSTADNHDISVIESTDQRTGSDMDPTSQLQSPESSKKNFPQTKKGRTSKVKPKPNLGQASRTALLKSQPGTSTVRRAEKSHTVAPELAQTAETLASAEETPKIAETCKNMLKDDISYIEVKRTEEPSGSRKRSVSEGQSHAATSQSASENQSHYFSEAQLEPSLEQATGDSRSTSGSTDEVLMSHVGTIESICNNQVTSDSAVTEPQTGQGSNIDSAPVQESSDHPAPCVTAVEELPVSQREESEVGSTHQRKSRFQKPKVNLAQISRTVRSKPQTTKDTVEEDSNTAPNPKFHEKTIAEVEAEPTCLTSPEKPSRPDPASDLIPLVDLGTTLTATEELSTTEEKKTDGEVVGQVESDAVTSHQSVSENQNVSEAQFTPRREQATRDTMPILESLDEKLMANFGAAESSCNDPQLTSDSAVTESQTEQGSNIDSAPVQESSDHPAPCVTAVEELPVSQREKSEVGSTFQSMRRRLQRVQPKPNLPQTSRTARSKPHTTNAPVTPMQHADTPSSQTSRPEFTDNTTAMEEAQPTCSTTPPEKTSQIKSTSTASVPEPSMELCSPHTTTEGMSSAEQQKTDAGRGLDSNSKGSEQNVLQRRPRFSKVKPNLGSSPRTTRAKLQSSDISKPPEQCHMDASLTSQQPVDNNNAQTEQDLTGTDDQHLTSTRCSLRTEPFSSTKLGPAEPEKSLDGTNDKVEAVPASQWERKRDMSIRATESNTQPTDDPTRPTNTQSTADPKESTQQPLPENDCEAQSPDAVQQCSEGNQTAAQNTDGNQSEPTDSPSRTAPQTRRGRLIKPKPRLVRSRPPQPRQDQNTKQAEKEGEDASVCHKLVSELRPDIPDPADGDIEQCSNQNSSPKDPGSSLGCLTQDASTSNTDETQNHLSLSIVPEMLSQQEPSDPDEPFFILSLTEIPVCPLSEAVDSVPEHLPYLPVTDASIEQQSVPGESSTAAGEGPLSGPASLEESGETGLVSVQDVGPDPAARVTQQDWIMENPVEPHESTTVHPSKLSETLENNDEMEIPPVKPDGPLGTRRRGKVQVKPKTSKRKQASKTLATEHSELPGPSLQPEACDDVVTEPQKGSGDHVDVEKETLTGGDHPEDSSSGAQTTRTRVTGSRNRKAKGFPPIMSETNITAPAGDSPPGKGTSKGPKLRTPRAAGKRSTPAPVASTSRDVAPTRSATQLTEDTHSTSFTTSQTEVDVEQTSEHSRVTTPNTSLCPAEVSASQQSDSVESSSIEEPTSVSQYFLCDIFTEVEEG